MPEVQVYLQPCDQVEWDGKNFIFYPDGGTRAYPVQNINSEHPYVILPDPKEEDYYEGGELKGDIERESG